MKKLLALLIAMVMVFGLVACGGGKEDTAKESEAAPVAEDEAEETEEADEVADDVEDTEDADEPAGDAEELKVGVFYYDFADAYISTVRNELDKMLGDAGVAFDNYDAATEQPKQTEQVQSAVIAGANLLIVNVVDTASVDAAQGIADLAKENDIPVIFFNREVDDSVVNSYEKAAFVGTDAPEAGHMQGEMIGNYLLENYDDVDINGDGVITYAMFKGQEGNAEADARTQFAVEDADKLLEEAGKEKLKYYNESAPQAYQVDPNSAWSAAFGQDAMGTILGTYNEDNDNMVELVIANNDEMAIGAITALENAGYNKEGGRYIPVFGVDATETAVGKIDEGSMMGSIKQDNVGMASTITTLVTNLKDGYDIMANTDDMNVDEGVAKIRVPYAIYTK